VHLTLRSIPCGGSGRRICAARRPPERYCRRRSAGLDLPEMCGTLLQRLGMDIDVIHVYNTTATWAGQGTKGIVHRRRPARTGWTYPVLGKEGVNALCQLGALERSQTIGFEHPGCGTQHEINGDPIATRGGSVRRVTGHNSGRVGQNGLERS